MQAYAEGIKAGAPIEVVAALVEQAEVEAVSIKLAEEEHMEQFIASIMRNGGDWAEVVTETARLAAAAHMFLAGEEAARERRIGELMVA